MATKDKLKERGKKAGTKKRKPSKKKGTSPGGTPGGKDPYRIGPVGGSTYSSSFTVFEKYENMKYKKFELIGMGEEPKQDETKFTRETRFTLVFKCCKQSGPVKTGGKDSEIKVEVLIQDIYISKTKAKDRGKLSNWSNKLRKESGDRIANAECEDWNSQFKGCSISTTDVENKEYDVSAKVKEQKEADKEYKKEVKRIKKEETKEQEKKDKEYKKEVKRIKKEEREAEKEAKEKAEKAEKKQQKKGKKKKGGTYDKYAGQKETAKKESLAKKKSK